MKRLVWIFGLSVGCMAEDALVEGAPEAAVIRTMRLERIARGNISPGFDLDDAVTDSSHAVGCNQNDRTSPSGVPGIDNQVGELLPLIDIAAEGALDAFLQNAIDEGRLLLLPEVRKIGGRYQLSLLRGTDAPLIGSDGRILDHQTFALHPEKSHLGSFDDTTVEGDMHGDGRLVAGPFDVDLLVVVFDILYELKLERTRLEITFDSDGVGHGVLAGGARIETLKRLADVAGKRGGVDLLAIVGTAFDDLADLRLDPTPRCTGLSVVATFDTVPAYVRR